MTDRWEQVKQILHDAAELPPPQRKAFVEGASCGDFELIAEVESLLASFDEAEDFLEDAPIQLGAPGDALEGRWVGEYRVDKLIASGGMGSVYLASKEIDGFPMRVALKFIRFAGPGEYVARRFRMERQILARLTHENILRLLDCGVTSEGLPFLVTEYLDGYDLEEWLRDKKPSLKQRLELFLEICEAVSYAHRNLVIHGDLKPSNILVTREGVPKLVDFGIARLVKSQETTDPAQGQATITLTPALTPWWASPEQLRGEPLSIESDCYELGRILFFLLTEKVPFDFTGQNTLEILERLKREAPPKLSAFAGDPALVGDLDNIVLKALEYDKNHRYRNVDALAEDLVRYLSMRPVSARPNTWTYRFEKFIKRNKGLVAVVTSAALALLVAVGAALYQANEARKNYENSRQRFDQLRSLANVLIFRVDDTLAPLQGATPVRAELVKSALGYLDELSKQDTKDPRLQEEVAAAYEKIGDIQGRPGTTNLGQTAQSLESYRKSEALREEVRKASKRNAGEFQKASERLANIYARLSAALRATGDATSALTYERKALGIRQALFEGDTDNMTRKRALASSITTLSGSLSQLGDWAGVLETRKEALKMHEEIAAADPRNASDQRGLALALARMGSIEMHEKQLKEALGHYQRSLAIDMALVTKDYGNVAFQLSAGLSNTNYGIILHRMGRAKEALDYYRRGSAYYEKVAKADAQEVRSKTLWQTNRVHAAKALIALGRAKEALPLAELALRERVQLAVKNRLNAGAQGEVAESHAALGQAYAALGRHEKASDSLVTAKRMLEELVQTDRSNAAMKEQLQQVERDLKALGGTGHRESDAAANSR